jgi:hypothetical protein
METSITVAASWLHRGVDKPDTPLNTDATRTHYSCYDSAQGTVAQILRVGHIYPPKQHQRASLPLGCPLA